VLNLREMLLRGDFRPGERISELPLVARLGVSRTPIRLALDRLAHEGLLEIFPSGGFVVKEFTVADIWDAIETRGVLEGAAARLAAERFVRDRDLEGLRKLRNDMDAILRPGIDSFVAYLDLNDVFHAEIVELARSPMLRRTLDRVFSLPFASPSGLVYARSKLPRAAELLIIGQEHHHAIVEAIENRQGARAESLAREHSRLSRRNLEIALSDTAIMNCVPGAKLIKLPAPA
jgi:GntR family transcriptional regulator, vanillate catabolism transcriptional regulator